VIFDFPAEFNATAIRESTIGTTRPIPTRFLPNYNSTSYLELPIIVTSSASYNGVPGVFRLAGDGYFTIYTTTQTSGSTTPANNGEKISFQPGNPAGLKSASVRWNTFWNNN
jgi:hypothetical protein